MFFDSDATFVVTQLTNRTCQGAIISNYYFHFWISEIDQKYTNIQFECLYPPNGRWYSGRILKNCGGELSFKIYNFPIQLLRFVQY